MQVCFDHQVPDPALCIWEIFKPAANHTPDTVQSVSKLMHIRRSNTKVANGFPLSLQPRTTPRTAPSSLAGNALALVCCRRGNGNELRASTTYPREQQHNLVLADASMCGGCWTMRALMRRQRVDYTRRLHTIAPSRQSMSFCVCEIQRLVKICTCTAVWMLLGGCGCFPT
ncbi:hypothetical protein BKA81DRAFT_185851 [Phyllosticta paracitricarpa]